MKEVILSQQFTFTNCTLALLILFALYMLISSVFYKPKRLITEEEMSYMPRGKRFEVDQVFSNTRYSTKSVTKINEDLDRYGRFQIVTKSGSVKTITGKLSVILLNNAVSSYREIR